MANCFLEKTFALAILLSALCTKRVCSLEEEFLSLACGREGKYLDPKTNLTWDPDDQYVNGFGRGVLVVTVTNNELFQHLRYFDEKKSCYTLPTRSGNFYLIRGSFLYNNYDSKNIPPSFQVLIDTTLVSSGRFNQSEVIFKAEKQEVNYCLISIETSGKPFISTLELRHLSDYSAPYAIGMLKTLRRLDCGNTNKMYRYPVDSSDFIWETDAHEVVNNTSITYNTSASYVPKIIMETAAYANPTLSYTFSPDDMSLDYYVCLYFLELSPSVKPGHRVFSVYANGVLIKKNLDIVASVNLSHSGVNLHFKVPAASILNISLVATGTSQEGPILNALEVYQIVKPARSTLKTDVDALLRLKSMYPQLKWSGDPCLPPMTSWNGLVCELEENKPATIVQLNLEFRGLNGSIPTSIAGLGNLEILRLDGNVLSGGIPDFRSLSHLTKLELQDNDISGTIPEYLAHMPSLTTLHLQNNNLSGEIPPALLNKPGLTFTYSGNPLGNVVTETRRKDNLLKYFIVGFVGGFVILLFILAGCLIYVSRKPKIHLVDIAAASNNQLKATPKYEMKSAKCRKEPSHIRQLTTKEVGAATNCYKTMIGQGGFGAVYYGTLSNGQAVAVKVRSLNSFQGTREFNTELNLLSRIQHENLVPLLGFCSEDEQEILVYPFMPNGSLQDRLYGEVRRKPLDWPTRLSIALGAARGLAYLHSGGELSIIHRDVKSSNILLDQSMTAKVADFGFSKYAPSEGDSVASLEIRGTAGYLDPEYYLTQQLTVKSDVYGFGVVLLEIICGREPLSIDRPRTEWSLVEWARPFIQDTNIQAIVDPTISANYIPEAMWRVVEVALLSVQPHASRRPSMIDIVRELEDALIIETNASQFMASIESNPSHSLSDKQFHTSPVFSETLGSPDAR